MKGNTPAWQGYVEGKLNEVTGEPLYVAGEDLQKNEGFLDFIKTGFSKNRQKNIKDGTHHKTDYNGKKEKDGTIFSNVSKRNAELNKLMNQTANIPITPSRIQRKIFAPEMFIARSARRINPTQKMLIRYKIIYNQHKKTYLSLRNIIFFRQRKIYFF